MMQTRDALGDRMKADYESRTRHFLPRRTYTLIRVDGKAFHTYTRSCARPFDVDFMEDMDRTAAALCENIEGAKLAFVQSDDVFRHRQQRSIDDPLLQHRKPTGARAAHRQNLHIFARFETEVPQSLIGENSRRTAGRAAGDLLAAEIARFFDFFFADE